MSKYVCTDGHVFIHPAKQTRFLEPKEIPIDEDTTVKVGDSMERTVCPFCFSLTYAEAPEDSYVDWAQVLHKDVKEKLDAGWRVLSHTKENVVMAKCKEA